MSNAHRWQISFLIESIKIHSLNFIQKFEWVSNILFFIPILIYLALKTLILIFSSLV